ncbi:hypothetical protein KKE78_01575 [Patescibacteria group bacterium]|nr:hypothetical protein [Patescibacteria group bacterium]
MKKVCFKLGISLFCLGLVLTILVGKSAADQSAFLGYSVDSTKDKPISVFNNFPAAYGHIHDNIVEDRPNRCDEVLVLASDKCYEFHYLLNDCRTSLANPSDRNQCNLQPLVAATQTYNQKQLEEFLESQCVANFNTGTTAAANILSCAGYVYQQCVQKLFENNTTINQTQYDDFQECLRKSIESIVKNGSTLHGANLSAKKVTNLELYWGSNSLFSGNANIAEINLDLSKIDTAFNPEESKNYDMTLFVYFDGYNGPCQGDKCKKVSFTIRYTAPASVPAAGTGTKAVPAGDAGTNTAARSCDYRESCGSGGTKLCHGKLSKDANGKEQCIFITGSSYCEGCEGESGTPNSICPPGAYDIQCTGNCAGCDLNSGEATVKHCNSSGTAWEDRNPECNVKCAKCGDRKVSGPSEGSRCEYPEQCSTGGVHRCTGTIQGGVCKYNPAIDPYCTACY